MDLDYFSMFLLILGMTAPKKSMFRMSDDHALLFLKKKSPTDMGEDSILVTLGIDTSRFPYFSKINIEDKISS